MSNFCIDRIEFRNMTWDESNFGVSINEGVRRTYWRLTNSRDKIPNDDAELLRLLLKQINLFQQYTHLSAKDSIIIDNKNFNHTQWRELLEKAKRGKRGLGGKAKRKHI